MEHPNCIFIGWNQPVSGREMPALETFQSFSQFLDEQDESGQIEDYTHVSMPMNGSDLVGFTLIQGDPEQIQALRGNETFGEFMMKGDHLLQDFRLHSCFTGEAAHKMKQQFGEIVRQTGTQ